MRLNYLAIPSLALVGFAAANPLNLAGSRRAIPTPVSVEKAKTYLGELVVAAPSNDPPYKRAFFPHWITISGECNTRETVLKRDGTNVTTNDACASTAGTWYSEYDGATWTDAQDLDIDHIIPLKEAWVSGARNWTAARRQALANDLDRPQLIAVTDNVNQVKGDKDPALWMPPLPSYYCTYVRAWIEVKHFYELTVDSAEKAALTNYINQC
ncbi:hypothetical protein BDV93DRAFT_528596 [Ceratobasidium sp. AG-I]|nr:hypothetical protein BDV93DRAFT_528596 [Ceratobasidium sp. AG-I]